MVSGVVDGLPAGCDNGPVRRGRVLAKQDKSGQYDCPDDNAQYHISPWGEFGFQHNMKSSLRDCSTIWVYSTTNGDFRQDGDIMRMWMERNVKKR